MPENPPPENPPENIRPGDEPSLDAVRRSDDFVDALAAGRPVAPQDQADAALAALLGGWRDDIRSAPEPDLVTESEAVAALNAGLADRPAGAGPERPTAVRRSRRGLSVIGAVAAGMLCIGGFGAVVAGSGPGEPLYGLRTMLFGAPKQVRDDQVALAARTELNQVQDLIAAGDWQQAEAKLVAVSSQVASIGDEQQKQELLSTWNDLSAKVVERDPEATAPPGITYTVPPAATELVPAVAPPTPPTPPTSVPTAATTATTTATTGAATTATTSATASPTATATTSATATATTTASTAPATTTASTAPATTTATSPTAATTSPTAATTTTTKAPAATTSTATTAGAASPPATTPASAAAPATTTAPTLPAAAEPVTTTPAPAAGADTEADTGSDTGTDTGTDTGAVPEAPAVTTTVAVPVPEPAG